MNMQLIQRGATESYTCGCERRTPNRKIEKKMEKRKVKKNVIGKQYRAWV
jgi:hypothetical protein